MVHPREHITKLINSNGVRGVMIAFVGNLHYRHGPKIQHEFDLTLQKNRSAGIVLDLRKVHHLDASILGMLVYFQRRTESSAIPLVVVPSTEISEILYATRLQPVFTLVNTVDEALESLDLKPLEVL